jgi:hypothetical protein
MRSLGDVDYPDHAGSVKQLTKHAQTGRAKAHRYFIEGKLHADGLQID